MEIVRVVDSSGERWGRRSDGSWVRWDRSLARWGRDPVSSPPFEIDDVPKRGPSNALDRWWMRTFPPYSARRLVFGIVALGVFAGATAVFGDGTLPTFLFVVIAGSVCLAVPFMLDSFGRRRGRPAVVGVGRRRTLAEGLVTFPILFVSLAVVGAVIRGGFPPVFTLVVDAVMSAYVTAVLALRRTIWAPVLLALGGGAVAAVILPVLTFWLSGEAHPLALFLFGSIGTFVFVLPFWLRVRSFELPGAPVWVFPALVGFLMVASVVFASTSVEPYDPGFDVIRPLATAGPLVGAPTKEDAARGLFGAWQRGNRGEARGVAQPTAVDDLFAIPSAGAVYRGAATFEGQRVHVIELPAELVLLYSEFGAPGSAYVRHIRRVPLDTPVDYERGSR